MLASPVRETSADIVIADASGSIFSASGILKGNAPSARQAENGVRARPRRRAALIRRADLGAARTRPRGEPGCC